MVHTTNTLFCTHQMDVRYVVSEHDAGDGHGPHNEHSVFPQFEFLHQFLGRGLLYFLHQRLLVRGRQGTDQTAADGAQQACTGEESERIAPSDGVN